jgi:hypothetical protein
MAAVLILQSFMESRGSGVDQGQVDSTE